MRVRKGVKLEEALTEGKGEFDVLTGPEQGVEMS